MYYDLAFALLVFFRCVAVSFKDEMNFLVISVKLVKFIS